MDFNHLKPLCSSAHTRLVSRKCPLATENFLSKRIITIYYSQCFLSLPFEMTKTHTFASIGFKINIGLPEKKFSWNKTFTGQKVIFRNQVQDYLYQTKIFCSSLFWKDRKKTLELSYRCWRCFPILV